MYHHLNVMFSQVYRDYENHVYFYINLYMVIFWNINAAIILI